MHTKGPWHVREQHPGRSNTPMWFIAPEGPEPGTCAIARIIRGDAKLAERKANAQLIAAAPELLEAAKGLMAEFDAPVPDLTLKTLYRKKLRDAIAKAEGRS